MGYFVNFFVSLKFQNHPIWSHCYTRQFGGKKFETSKRRFFALTRCRCRAKVSLSRSGLSLYFDGKAIFCPSFQSFDILFCTVLSPCFKRKIFILNIYLCLNGARTFRDQLNIFSPPTPILALHLSQHHVGRSPTYSLLTIGNMKSEVDVEKSLLKSSIMSIPLTTALMSH